MLDDIKKTLWATADKRRANMDAAEYKHIVLGLIFLKYISDTFTARREELTRRFTDEADEYFLHECDEEMLAEELEDRDYYKEANVFWVPEEARWENLRNAAKQPDIGKRIDEALSVIEAENPKLTEDEVRFYDALADNESADGELGDETLKNIAHELTENLKQNLTVDWCSRESVRAKLRLMDKRILRKYKYPPDQQVSAIELVLQQAKVMGEA